MFCSFIKGDHMTEPHKEQLATTGAKCMKTAKQVEI